MRSTQSALRILLHPSRSDICGTPIIDTSARAVLLRSEDEGESDLEVVVGDDLHKAIAETLDRHAIGDSPDQVEWVHCLDRPDVLEQARHELQMPEGRMSGGAHGDANFSPGKGNNGP